MLHIIKAHGFCDACREDTSLTIIGTPRGGTVLCDKCKAQLVEMLLEDKSKQA